MWVTEGHPYILDHALYTTQLKSFPWGKMGKFTSHNREWILKSKGMLYCRPMRSINVQQSVTPLSNERIVDLLYLPRHAWFRLPVYMGKLPGYMGTGYLALWLTSMPKNQDPSLLWGQALIGLELFQMGEVFDLVGGSTWVLTHALRLMSKGAPVVFLHNL